MSLTLVTTLAVLSGIGRVRGESLDTPLELDPLTHTALGPLNRGAVPF